MHPKNIKALNGLLHGKQHTLEKKRKQLDKEADAIIKEQEVLWKKMVNLDSRTQTYRKKQKAYEHQLAKATDSLVHYEPSSIETRKAELEKLSKNALKSNPHITTDPI